MCTARPRKAKKLCTISKTIRYKQKSEFVGINNAAHKNRLNLIYGKHMCINLCSLTDD